MPASIALIFAFVQAAPAGSASNAEVLPEYDEGILPLWFPSV